MTDYKWIGKCKNNENICDDYKKYKQNILLEKDVKCHKSNKKMCDELLDITTRKQQDYLQKIKNHTNCDQSSITMENFAELPVDYVYIHDDGKILWCFTRYEIQGLLDEASQKNGDVINPLTNKKFDTTVRI